MLAVYYMVNVGMLVNRRMELKKQGKLHEELVSGLCLCSIAVHHLTFKRLA